VLTEPQQAPEAKDETVTDASGDGRSQRRIELVVQSLQVRFGTSVDTAFIATVVEAEFATYGSARIREFVPILVETHVQTRLRQLRP
jgi:hypothetical protein